MISDKEYMDFLKCAEKDYGVCQCNLKRCPSCGYTKHDKMYWMDHSYCKGAKKMKLKYWSVAFSVGATGHMLVEAETKEAAREYAENNFCADSENTEIGDAMDLVDCQELTEGEYKRYKCGRWG